MKHNGCLDMRFHAGGGAGFRCRSYVFRRGDLWLGFWDDYLGGATQTVLSTFIYNLGALIGGFSTSIYSRCMLEDPVNSYFASGLWVVAVSYD
jgi:hypothetical protein